MIGQLQGGDNNIGCSGTGSLVDNDKFGRFSVSWTGGGTNSTRLSNWLSTSGTPPTTTNTIRVPSVSGSSIICSSSAQTFTLNDIIPGRTATWAVTPSSLFVTASGSGTSASLQVSSSSVFGFATLTFTISAGSGCSTVLVTRQIWVGKPDIDITGDKELCTGDRGEAYVVYNGGTDAITQGISSFSWSYNGPLSSFTIHGDQVGYRAGGSAGYGTIGVTATNACGSTQANLPYEVIDCGKGLAIKVWPNPTYGISTVEISGQNTSNVEKFDLTMYNRLGKVILSKTLRDRDGQIDLSGLEPGIYFVEISDGISRHHERILKIR